jgi:histidine triad (HIT) family protein
MSCIFCKIISKEIPNFTVFENENVLAFLDIHPCSKGHCVVVPKKHFETIFELDLEVYRSFFEGVKLVMEKIDKVLKPEGYNVGWNHGKVAGQAVSHLHAHIMPRWNGDGGGSQHSIINNPGSESHEEVHKLFVSYDKTL